MSAGMSCASGPEHAKITQYSDRIIQRDFAGDSSMPTDGAARLLMVEVDRAALLAGNLAVVRCRGKLVAGETGILYDEVHPLLAGTKRIVLDLTDLTHMDSMGLGVLVRLYVSARSASCDLRLINLGARIKHLLSISNLLSVFADIEEYDVPIH